MTIKTILAVCVTLLISLFVACKKPAHLEERERLYQRIERALEGIKKAQLETNRALTRINDTTINIRRQLQLKEIPQKRTPIKEARLSQ